MKSTALWTKQFIAIMIANGLFFVSFHSLLPTLPMYVASLGATGTEIGIISGIFSLSAIGIRVFTDDIVYFLGKKTGLYLGIFFTLIATISYPFVTSVPLLIGARLIQGLGFGLGTTFAAALAVDIIPPSRRGEGVGFFGMGNTVSIGLAPAIGVSLLTTYGSSALFTLSTMAPALAIIATWLSGKGADAVRRSKEKVRLSLWNRFIEKGTAFPSFCTMLFGFSFGSVNTYIALFAQSVGIENSGIFFMTGTFVVFLTRTFGGRLYDAKGPFFVILPGIIAYAMAAILILCAKSFAMLITASVFYGLGAGLMMPALMTWLFSAVMPERRSNASATFYNMMDIGTSIGIIALGALSGLVGYTRIFYVVLAVMLFFLVSFMYHHASHRTASK